MSLRIFFFLPTANTRVKRQSTKPEIGHRLETLSQPSTWNIYPVKKSNRRLTSLSNVQRNIEKNRSSRFEKYGWATRYRYTLCRISCTRWPGCKRVCGQTKRHCAPRLFNEFPYRFHSEKILLTVPIRRFNITTKRGTEHSHRSLKAVGNPRYRYEIAAHARDAREPPCLTLYLVSKISYVFKLQDKHNASF